MHITQTMKYLRKLGDSCIGIHVLEGKWFVHTGHRLVYLGACAVLVCQLRQTVRGHDRARSGVSVTHFWKENSHEQLSGVLPFAIGLYIIHPKTTLTNTCAKCLLHMIWLFTGRGVIAWSKHCYCIAGDHWITGSTHQYWHISFFIMR